MYYFLTFTFFLKIVLIVNDHWKLMTQPRSVMSNYRYLKILDQELGTNRNTHSKCYRARDEIGLSL